MTEIRIGDNIFRLRKQAKITQEELASFLNLTKASVSKWETGQSLPDLLLLPQIAAFFDVTVDQLIGYEPQLSEQQIRKIYQELSGDFVKLSFDEAIEKCRKLVKTYYACYPFLYQIGNLWLNHVSLAVIVFSVMIAAPLAEEYKKQTLIPLMARGLTLPTAACAKAAAAVITWTLCYWICFLITWLYNLWFWGNKDISHTLAAAAFIWLFGLWVTTLLFLGSVLFRSVSGALLMAAAGALAGWILTLFAKTAAWSPMQLLSAGTLLNLRTLPEDYKKAALAALITGLAAFGSALLVSRKQNAL